jgi:hypothetical protein
LAFFFALAAVLFAISLGLAIPLLPTYFRTHQVPRLPTAVLATGLVVLAFLSGTAGLVLDTVTRGRREAKMLAYLSVERPGAHLPPASPGRSDELDPSNMSAPVVPDGLDPFTQADHQMQVRALGSLNEPTEVQTRQARP